MEVSNSYSGMFCHEGDELQLRVYGGGRVEYEELPDDAPCREAKPTRKLAELTAEELKALSGLLAQPDLLAAKEEYPAFAYYFDTRVKETIILTNEGRMKKIVLHNPVMTNPEVKKNYPPSLLKLLDEIKRIRLRIAPRDWDNGGALSNNGMQRTRASAFLSCALNGARR